jgi:hypothetical protein
LTEGERDATDKEISLEGLKETLEDADSGKTPGADGLGKKFMTRYWSKLVQTIYYAKKKPHSQGEAK